MFDPATVGYLQVFLLLFASSVVPPLPFEPVVSAGGIAVAEGRLDFALLVLAAAAGSVAGNLLWWGLGYWLGYERLRPFVERHQRWLTFDWTSVERLHRHFERWGWFTVFLFRFMPAGRTLISLPAGLMRMPLRQFTVFTAAGCMVWDSFLAALGYGLRLGFADIGQWVSPIVTAIIAAIILVYLWRLATWKPR